MCHQYILGIDIGTVSSSSVYIQIFTISYVNKRRLQYVGIKESNTSNNDYEYPRNDNFFKFHVTLIFSSVFMCNSSPFVYILKVIIQIFLFPRFAFAGNPFFP